MWEFGGAATKDWIEIARSVAEGERARFPERRVAVEKLGEGVV